tara:strand:+ start:282 stop:425 length:144 start_codon:yes stop_codon:yes gene_type:complete
MLNKQAVVALERDVNHAIGRNVKSLESAEIISSPWCSNGKLQLSISI